MEKQEQQQQEQIACLTNYWTYLWDNWSIEREREDRANENAHKQNNISNK